MTSTCMYGCVFQQAFAGYLLCIHSIKTDVDIICYAILELHFINFVCDFFQHLIFDEGLTLGFQICLYLTNHGCSSHSMKSLPEVTMNDNSIEVRFPRDFISL